MLTSVLAKLVKLLMAIFIIGALAVFIGANLLKPRVLVLHSYDLDYSWVRDINVGINRVLHSKGYNIRWHYMRHQAQPEQRIPANARASLARRIIDEWKPDLITAVDDDAQKYRGRMFARRPTRATDGRHHLQIVYAGLNGAPTPYGYDKA